MDPRSFLDSFVSDLLANPSQDVAGSPSFDIKDSGGDARRRRKGLSPADVQRLIEANPDFADQIRQMYLPGASSFPIRQV